MYYLPDSWWDDGRLKSAERNSDQQGCHSSKDEEVVVHFVCNWLLCCMCLSGCLHLGVGYLMQKCLRE